MLPIVIRFGFRWRDIADRLQQALMVIPMYPMERGQLQLVPAGLRPSVRHFGLTGRQSFQPKRCRRNRQRCRPRARCPLRPSTRCSELTRIGCRGRSGWEVTVYRRAGDLSLRPAESGTVVTRCVGRWILPGLPFTSGTRSAPVWGMSGF